MNPNGSTYSYFMSTLDPVAQALVPHILTLDTSDDGRTLDTLPACFGVLLSGLLAPGVGSALGCTRLQLWGAHLAIMHLVPPQLQMQGRGMVLRPCPVPEKQHVDIPASCQAGQGLYGVHESRNATMQLALAAKMRRPTGLRYESGQAQK